MTVDVVIPVHNARRYVDACLTSLLETAQQQIERLIIVDDASEADTKDFLREWCEQKASDISIELLTTPRQQWFTRAANLGLRSSSSEHVVLLNSDCELLPGWLDELETVMSVSSSTLVGALYEPTSAKRWEIKNEPEYVTGHCWLLSRRAFELVGFLDEVSNDAIHINSDRYFCYNLNRAGATIAYAYHARVLHYGAKSWDTRRVWDVLSLRVEDLA